MCGNALLLLPELRRSGQCARICSSSTSERAPPHLHHPFRNQQLFFSFFLWPAVALPSFLPSSALFAVAGFQGRATDRGFTPRACGRTPPQALPLYFSSLSLSLSLSLSNTTKKKSRRAQPACSETQGPGLRPQSPIYPARKAPPCGYGDPQKVAFRAGVVAALPSFFASLARSFLSFSRLWKERGQKRRKTGGESKSLWILQVGWGKEVV